jgi:chemotaxis methyl-accepting protein methylase
MDDRQFSLLLDFFGKSWKGYRKVRRGVKKRVARHMQELGCRNMEVYLERLASDPEAGAECERRMSVSVSRFFRDLRIWEVLSARVLPELIRRSGGGIRVWFAGCGCGEEVYSFQILWEECRKRFSGSGSAPGPDPMLVASDIHPEHLDKAKKGVYGRGSLKEVSDATREACFEPLQDGYAVRSDLKRGICWKRHHILADPPPGRAFDLVFLRNNLLTYYQEPLQARGLSQVGEALRSGGFLVIGNSERLPRGEYGWIAYERGIYRKA